MKNALLLLVFTFLLSTIASTQVDSCRTYRDSFAHYIYKDKILAHEFAVKAFDYSNDEGDNKCKLVSYTNLMLSYFNQSQLDSARIIYDDLIAFEFIDSFPKYKSKAFFNIVGQYINSYKNEEALALLDQKIKNKITPSDSLRTFMLYAYVYMNTKKFQKSTEYAIKADMISKYEDTPKLTLTDLNNVLASNYYNLTDYQNAIKYQKITIKLRKELKHLQLLANNYITLAKSHIQLQELELVPSLIDSAEAYLSYYPQSKAALLNLKGDYNMNIRDFEKAIDFYGEGFDLYKDDPSNYYYHRIGISLLNNKLYLNEKTGYKEISQGIFQNASDVLSKLDTFNLLSYGLIENIANHNGQLADDLIELLILNREILDETEKNSLNEIMTRYETLKKELDIEKLEKENLQKSAELNQQRLNTFSAIGGAVFLFIIVLFLVIVYKRSKTHNNRLKDRNEQIILLNREINHRVKNNLAFMSGLMEMQARRLENLDAREAIKESESRIKVFGLIHESLYNIENNITVEFKSYIEGLLYNLDKSYDLSGRNIELNSKIDNISLNADDVIRIGLIINELVTNSVKHAFKQIDNPQINLTIKDLGEDKLELRYSDNGIGILHDKKSATNGSLGLKLIDLLSEQLENILTIEIGNAKH